MVTLVTKGGPR